MPSRLTAAASATDAAIHQKMLGSGRPRMLALCMTSLIISNEEMNDIMKTVRSLEESGLLIKDVCKTIKNEAKEEKGGLFGMFLGALGASLLENLLAANNTIRAGEGII